MEQQRLRQQAQTSLALEELISMFEQEVRTAVDFDSFEYEYTQDEGVHFFRGSAKEHKCRYRLAVMEDDFGHVTLTRQHPFSEKELQLFEKALGALAFHLRDTFQLNQPVAMAL